MSEIFKLELDTPAYKGGISFPTGLFIDGKFVKPVEQGKIDVVNPSTGRVITSVSVGTSKDVDIAVDAARKAYKTSWGLKVPGSVRGQMLLKLASLIEQNLDEFAALESLNVGKPFAVSKIADIMSTVACLRYYGGWADKVHGKTIEVSCDPSNWRSSHAYVMNILKTNENKLAYTRHEPYGVVGQIVPWNFPLSMASWKIGPALATGNCIILKPSEITPLTALKLASLVNEAGFPPGVINIVNGYGNTVGQSMAEHPHISKVAFTGSTLTGRKIQEASAKSNLKVVTLELGGKSPHIIFDDANLEQAVKWAVRGVFANGGQVCTAGSRIYLQEGIYDQFLQLFTEAAQNLSKNTGDPFGQGVLHGPQASSMQLDRVMSYIDSAKTDGATIHFGGERHGTEGFFVKPTIFTDCRPEMKIVREEIFGPCAAIIKFKTEEEVIEMANNTTYGLAAGVFTENSARGIRMAHALEAGSTFINCYNTLDTAIPFGGYKQSGIGRELGEYALDTYTQVKAVHVNLGMKL
ncbi:hypothetical protein D9758_006895 [Tetrapyrgos nigripes]|uniref:Aldehyde dehydrogenase domain-containing protein n=1 Tax=Tetrapyrgos nigripes TaxID=182062 RepID=A0A8H5GSX8_9AGAR|nr:hypothetical protein D9758_006895 [Tetrapyrgos nigripes]